MYNARDIERARAITALRTRLITRVLTVLRSGKQKSSFAQFYALNSNPVAELVYHNINCNYYSGNCN